MTLWLLMTVLCSAVSVAISVPLVRRYEDLSDRAAKGAAIYEDQIKEVDRDLSAGTIKPAEADTARAEIQKRLAKAARDPSEARPISPAWRTFALVASAGLVILGGVNLYGLLGSPEMPSTVSSAAPAQQQAQTSNQGTASNSGNAAGQIEDLINKRRAMLQTNPNDAEGWRILGWALFTTQRFQESADAYGKAVDIDPNDADTKAAYAESIVQAAQGVVTPKAQALIADVLAKSPTDFRARYYDALGHEQSGDQSGALDRWLSLLTDTPGDASWRDDVKQRVADLGKTLDRDVSAALNAVPVPAAKDQQEMIKAMVQRLADKMKENPKDSLGWMRLMRAYQVLHETGKAKEALATALAAFAADVETQGKLKAAATELGIN